MAQLGAFSTPLATAAGVLLLALGVALLRLSWLGRRPQNLVFLLPGWTLIIAGFFALERAWGAEVAAAYGLIALSLAAYAVVMLGAETRAPRLAKAREAALEPEERRTNWGRAIAKALLAIVLAGIASIGVGVAFAVAMPMATHDRIVIGGLLVPLLWGAGMAWTLADAKLVRASLLLAAVSVLGYAIAFLPKAF